MGPLGGGGEGNGRRARARSAGAAWQAQARVLPLPLPPTPGLRGRGRARGLGTKTGSVCGVASRTHQQRACSERNLPGNRVPLPTPTPPPTSEVKGKRPVWLKTLQPRCQKGQYMDLLFF